MVVLVVVAAAAAIAVMWGLMAHLIEWEQGEAFAVIALGGELKPGGVGAAFAVGRGEPRLDVSNICVQRVVASCKGMDPQKCTGQSPRTGTRNPHPRWGWATCQRDCTPGRSHGCRRH